jgi:hypothetical protein
VEDVEQPPPPPQHAKEEEQISNTKQQKQQQQKPHRDDEPAPKDDHGEEAEPEEEEETRPQQQQQQQLEEEGQEDSADDEIENVKRREAVKGAFLHAWNSYVRHAWGFDELQVRHHHRNVKMSLHLVHLSCLSCRVRVVSCRVKRSPCRVRARTGWGRASRSSTRWTPYSSWASTTNSSAPAPGCATASAGTTR